MVRIGLVHAAAGGFPELTRRVLEARMRGCHAVCFPEAFLTGYFPKEAPLHALTREALQPVSRLAAETGVDILTGFLEEDRGNFYITQGLFRPDGQQFFYRKTHLGLREAETITPGEDLPVFPLSCGVGVGIALCVELHFPEIARTLAEKGALLILSPHAVPQKAGSREAIWSRLLPARSYDNRVYMACCNLWGGCMATDPRGDTVLSCFDADIPLAVFDLDPELAEALRADAFRYFPPRRRPELYK